MNHRPHSLIRPPTPHQEHLLAAALLPPEQAAAAWARWQQEVDLVADPVDGESFRLLPLVYHNLHAALPDAPHMARLKGIHRRAWVENQTHLHAGGVITAALQAEGLSTLLFKATALCLGTYPNPGLRPLGEFDLLVPAAQAQQASDLIIAQGWQPVDPPGRACRAEFFTVRHAQRFSHPAGHRLALHWRSLPHILDPALDQPGWDAAHPLPLHSLSVPALAPTDLLLQVCVDREGGSSAPQACWAADAMMILQRHAQTLEWSRLVRRAAALQVGQSLAAALAYLCQTFAAEIPPATLAALTALPVTAAERRRLKAQAGQHPGLGKLARLWQHYQEVGARQNPRARGAGGFLHYLMVYANRGSVGELLPWAAGKLARQLFTRRRPT